MRLEVLFHGVDCLRHSRATLRGEVLIPEVQSLIEDSASWLSGRSTIVRKNGSKLCDISNIGGGETGIMADFGDNTVPSGDWSIGKDSIHGNTGTACARCCSRVNWLDLWCVWRTHCETHVDLLKSLFQNWRNNVSEILRVPRLILESASKDYEQSFSHLRDDRLSENNLDLTGVLLEDSRIVASSEERCARVGWEAWHTCSGSGRENQCRCGLRWENR